MKALKKYIVYWYHTSCISIAGNKAKMKDFDNLKDATKFHYNMFTRETNNETYQQGFVSHVAKNF